MEKTKFLTSLILILLLSCVNAATSEPTQREASKHFVLVHGACLGAWSWYKILALLKTSGHNVTAIDLGASGINPKQVLQISSLSDYFSPLMKFMTSLPSDKKVVLVGHSLGGFAISKAMESFPEKISGSVFLTALMPGPNLNATTLFIEAFSGVTSQLDNRLTYDNGPTNPPTTFIFGPNYLKSNFYQLSPIQDWALATTLVRPVPLFSLEDISKEMVLSSKKYGSVKRVFVLVPDDKAIKKEFQQQMIEKNPPNSVEEIVGADHMAMISKPLQLFTLLCGIANE